MELLGEVVLLLLVGTPKSEVCALKYHLFSFYQKNYLLLGCKFCTMMVTGKVNSLISLTLEVF